jgi:hypothetical protein
VVLPKNHLPDLHCYTDQPIYKQGGGASSLVILTRFESQSMLLEIQIMDTLTRAERSVRMGRVRSKDTKPEWIVRRLVHSLGFRYMLHDTKLPGKSDWVFPGRHKLIFVHGCFGSLGKLVHRVGYG